MNPVFVATDSACRDVVERLSAAPCIALDTEFVRERTYFPVLCLIQISDGDQVACIDTRAQLDLSPLMALADATPALTIHAARQDLEALDHDVGRLPARLEDTQIAAAMLGLGEQISYAALVEQICGVELAKSQTRTDWSRRPLSERQLHYAAEDVYFLPAVRDALMERLDGLGRSEWFRQECDALLEPQQYRPGFDDAWRRCKSRAHLNPAQRGAWQALCELRERRAVERNRPRRWLLADDAIERLAQLASDDLDGIRRELKQARAERTFDEVEVAQVMDNAGEVRWARPAKPTAQELRLLDQCVAKVKKTAAQLDMAPSLLASRKDITQFIAAPEQSRLLSGWRRDTIGTALQVLVANG